jgi:hypothetical protein
MPKTLADYDAALSPGDFEEIERAVMETPRGRWFLAEYAKRLRHDDSEAMLAAMAKLHTAIISSQDEIIQRLARALEATTEAAARPAVPGEPLTDRQMKYFKGDEALFEPSQTESAQAGMARLIIRNRGDMPEVQPPPGNPEPQFGSMPPLQANEPPKRRIVIIRRKPGEAIDVPLQQELAERS